MRWQLSRCVHPADRGPCDACRHRCCLAHSAGTGGSTFYLSVLVLERIYANLTAITQAFNQAPALQPMPRNTSCTGHASGSGGRGNAEETIAGAGMSTRLAGMTMAMTVIRPRQRTLPSLRAPLFYWAQSPAHRRPSPALPNAKIRASHPACSRPASRKSISCREMRNDPDALQIEPFCQRING